MSFISPIVKATPSASDQIGPREFAQLADYIFDYAGIRMPASKRTMLEGRLRRRQRALGFDTLEAYCRHVLTDNNLDQEGIHLINAVTTNKTDFFREPVHFDFLRDVALPGLEATYLRTIRAWSVACSTGPEPYTIAMLLDQFAATRRESRTAYWRPIWTPRCSRSPGAASIPPISQSPFRRRCGANI